jgi:DNA helicase HerA-like ATPase
MAGKEADRPPAVGTSKGPGDEAHTYSMISRDRSGSLKTGEFVYHVIPRADGRAAQVIGRVLSRKPVRLYPDSFLAATDVSPARLASSLGHDSRDDDLFEVTVGITGYFDEGMSGFVNPRALPRSGDLVYLAPSEMLTRVLSRKRLGSRGSAHVGRLLARDSEDVPVVLDVNEFTSTHLSIIAGTGAGKSYFAGVVAEELLKSNNRACLLIIDPHGEYDTLLDACDSMEFREGTYRPAVKILRSDEVKVRFGTLTLDDVRYLLASTGPGERMEWLLSEAYKRLSRRNPNPDDAYDQTPGGLIQAVQDIGWESQQRGTDYSSSIDGLLWRIQRQFVNSPNFDEHEHLDLDELFRPGQCTVLQLNEKDQRDQQVIVATVLRRLLKARMDTEKDRARPGKENYLPYPAFVLVEEAHHFAPAGADVVSSGVLKQVLAEGRKFGVGVGLISQRPGKLDSDALSQCMTHVIMRIVNPVDQSSIASSVESVGRDLLDELPALTKGQAVIAGSSLNTPVLCQTRTRITRHGGSSIDSAEQWASYFDKRLQSEQDEALVPKASARPDNLLRRS